MWKSPSAHPWLSFTAVRAWHGACCLKMILSLSEASKRPQKVSPEDDSPSLISEGTRRDNWYSHSVGEAKALDLASTERTL